MSDALVKTARPEVAALPGAAEAKTLSSLFEAAQNGMRRMVALGLFAHEIKAKLKQGQFGLWLREHTPHLSREVEGRPLASMTLTRYMQLASGVLESTGYNLKEYLETSKITQCDLSHGGEILLVEDSKVPEEARPMREKICELIDGKTQRQLFAEFKTADDEGEVAKAGGAKPIKFHCQEEKCGAPMKGIFGRKVTCPKCGTKQTAKPDPKSPEQQLAEDKELAADMVATVLEPGRIFLMSYSDSDEQWPLLVSDKDTKALVNFGRELVSWGQARLKKQVRAKSAKEAKAAKGGVK